MNFSVLFKNVFLVPYGLLYCVLLKMPTADFNLSSQQILAFRFVKCECKQWVEFIMGDSL